ncbi:uncharacterized protein LOC120357767 [Solenopsis invicta]|uniref:uncharacterized protein LOC120357767 n=1 Tax=Solenopsis invicta TaxID=13686 RepID=UPI00193E7AE6|nr:uncharacterized protein LOC120357767 [Solenopsis invicta]
MLNGEPVSRLLRESLHDKYIVSGLSGRSCFKQINDNLMNLVEPVTNGEPHILKRISYNKRNPLVEIKTLKKQHLAISNTVQVLNKISSLQLLDSITRIFSEVTFTTYFVIMRWKIGMLVDNVSSQMYDTFMIYTMIRSALKLGLLVWACETAKNQAVYINTTVHSVLNSTSNKQIKHELQLFALQLLHYKNVFSAKFFNMDVTLLTGWTSENMFKSLPKFQRSKACFKQINDNLMNLVEPVTNGEPHILKRISYNKRNPLVEIKALKKQHLAISNTVQVLNKISSLQLLDSITRIFSEVTFTTYFVIMRWKIGMLVDNVSSQMYDTFMIYSMTRSALKLGLLVWACETAKNQAVYINTTVHSVLNSTSNKQIRHELQLFALQLLHYKNVFSAKFFNMDVTLLTGMMGAIITHLLILVQFLFPCN